MGYTGDLFLIKFSVGIFGAEDLPRCQREDNYDYERLFDSGGAFTSAVRLCSRCGAWKHRHHWYGLIDVLGPFVSSNPRRRA